LNETSAYRYKFVVKDMHTDFNYIYSVIQKDGLNFIHLYFLNYTWDVNDLHNI